MGTGLGVCAGAGARGQIVGWIGKWRYLVWLMGVSWARAGVIGT